MLSKRSKRNSGSVLQLAENGSNKLEPIYSKVELLRQQLANKYHQNNLQINPELFNQTCKFKFLEINIDRDLQIQKMRKTFQSQHALNNHLDNNVRKNVSSSSSSQLKENKRDKAKSLINFLVNSKHQRSYNNKAQDNQQTKDQTHQKYIDSRIQKEDKFEPLGQEYKKEKLYQQSMKSQTHSLSSSRNDLSSLSSAQNKVSREKSSKKYLRKGTRVREILLRQLRTPQDRGSTSQGSSRMTYLKQHDQWVPSALVQQKKEQLQSFMSIIYGSKKSKKPQGFNLEKLQLIYL